jgi:putative radical SAM enzyme (TIGR03279 family)
MTIPLELPPLQLGPRPIRPDRHVEPHAIVEKVDPGSLGEEIGIRPGDEIVSINGSRMEDVIDYRFLIAEEEAELVIAPAGKREEAYTVSVEKDADETLGVTFTADVFDGIRICSNDCDFCFVYQNRRKMRRSLYIKDDDYRLSFLHGDFVTLTNLTDAHFERIIRLNLSPLYVSIHAWDPEVRVQLLRSPKGALIREHLERLLTNGIQVHGQIVLCPGVNEGGVLAETIEQTAARHPGILSMAIVPVGLTQFREKLREVLPVSPGLAGEIIDQCDGWRRRYLRELGTRFVFPSDEMYLLAARPVPGPRCYEGFEQVENGVGMVSRFEQEWRRAQLRLPTALPAPRRIGIVTGTLASPVLQPAVDRLRQVRGLDAELVPITNDFYGPSVTVAGLLVGEDILRQLQSHPRFDRVLLPTVCTRDGYFLDGLHVLELERDLGTPVRLIENRAGALVAGVMEEFPEGQPG